MGMIFLSHNGTQLGWFGIPANVLLFGVAALIMGIGWLWAIRMTRGDPEPDSFWATTKPLSRFNVFVKAGLVLLVLAGIALIATLNHSTTAQLLNTTSGGI